MIKDMTNKCFLAYIGILLVLAILLVGCVGNPEEQKLAELTKKAEAGDAEAQHILGLMYAKGDGVAKDRAKAAEWWQKAATQGSTKSQYNLGLLYARGDGVAKDMAKAAEWWQKAATQGDAKAQGYLGWLYEQGDGVAKDMAKAAELYQKAAEQGDAKAQISLGMMYEEGNGVAKDLAKAVELYQKAAGQGNAIAQFYLGLRYERGEGVPKDMGKAMEWYQKSATQGDADAQVNLGLMYYRGEGVPKDAAKAVEWWQKAASQGDTQAQINLASMYYRGEGVPKDAAKAVDWMKKAASQGHTAAQWSLGEMYANGEGVAQDRVLAYAWCNLAAAEGVRGAKDKRDSILLTPTQRSEAERLSSNWKEGQILARQSGTAPDRGPVSGGALSKTGTGTAFFVNVSGQAITNYHIVSGCTEVRAEGREGVVKVVTTDAVNDMALIQIPGAVSATAAISSDPAKLRQGEEIVVFGFPLNFLLSSGGNLTPGVVSALTGLGNNTNQIQITAPVQVGSSGSPVLNRKGEVVGMVSMKLSDSQMVKATGTVGQNVNFALSGQTLKTFLETHKADYRTIWLPSFNKSNADLADEARKWTLVVECWK